MIMKKPKIEQSEIDFLDKLILVAYDYDEEKGNYPESEYEGWSILSRYLWMFNEEKKGKDIFDALDKKYKDTKEFKQYKNAAMERFDASASGKGYYPWE